MVSQNKGEKDSNIANSPSFHPGFQELDVSCIETDAIDIVMILLETSFPSLKELKDLRRVLGLFLDVVSLMKMSTAPVRI